MMNNKIRHTGLAYLLLAVILGSLWLTLVAPQKSRWERHKSRTSELLAKVNLVDSRTHAAQQSFSQLENKINALVRAGSLSQITAASEAGHRLQEMVKQALQNSSATVLQMRPSTTADSQWLAQSWLEISFRIRADRLEMLLDSLAQMAPSLHIEMISLRQTVTATNSAMPPELDASASIAFWHLREPLTQFVEAVTEPLVAPVVTDSPTKPDVVPKPALLAGLFNAAYRDRLQNPSREHYRLTAVTVSANSRIAVIADVQTGTTRRLREGELLDSWTIQAISSSGVKLISGDRQEQLDLQRK